MKEMSYSEALKVLGLKGSPTDKDIRSAYLRLAKVWHPDVNNSKDATDRFKTISLANIVAKRGPNAPKISFADFRSEYRELKSLLKPGINDVVGLQDAEVLLVKKYSDDDSKRKKIDLARKMVDLEFSSRTNLRSRAKGVVLKHAYSNLSSPEQKKALAIDKMNKKLAFDAGIVELKSNVNNGLKSIKHSLRIKNDKVVVPVVRKVNRKKVFSYVALTSALIVAILTGRYFFNKKSGALEPVKLLSKGGKL